MFKKKKKQGQFDDLYYTQKSPPCLGFKTIGDSLSLFKNEEKWNITKKNVKIFCFWLFNVLHISFHVC